MAPGATFSVIFGLAGGAARDLTLGADYDVPPFNLGDPDRDRVVPCHYRTCVLPQHTLILTAPTASPPQLLLSPTFAICLSLSSPSRITTIANDCWTRILIPETEMASRYRSRPFGFGLDNQALPLAIGK